VNIGGTVAVITGGGSGIGRAMALALAAEGVRVAVIADIDEQGGEETARLVTATGARGVFFKTDVTDPEQLHRLIDQTQMQHTRLDILCNNAGIGEGGIDLFAEDTDEESWRRVVDVNLTAVIRGTRLGALKMQELGRGGVIVNTASMGALRPMPSSPVYAATKAAVVHFTRSLAYLHEEANVRVNAICPSFVETPLLERERNARNATLIEGQPVLQPEMVGKGLIELIYDDSKAGAIMRITPQKGIDFARDIAP